METAKLSAESGGSSHARASRWPTLNKRSRGALPPPKIETQSHQDKIAGSCILVPGFFFWGGVPSVWTWSGNKKSAIFAHHQSSSLFVLRLFSAAWWVGKKKAQKNVYTNTNEEELRGSHGYCLRLEEVSILRRLVTTAVPRRCFPLNTKALTGSVQFFFL